MWLCDNTLEILQQCLAGLKFCSQFDASSLNNLIQSLLKQLKPLVICGLFHHVDMPPINGTSW